MNSKAILVGALLLTLQNYSSSALACASWQEEGEILTRAEPASPNPSVAEPMQAWPEPELLFAMARSANHAEFRSFCDRHSTLIYEVDHNQRTALHHAAEAGQLENVNLLLRAQMDPDAPDRLGVTPTMLAENLSHTTVVNRFRKHRQSRGVNITDLTGN